jgi:hypothetical protein
MGQFKIPKRLRGDSGSVFSKSMRERLLRPEDFITRRIPKHIAGDRSFVFEADAHALRKRLPPKQTITLWETLLPREYTLRPGRFEREPDVPVY